MPDPDPIADSLVVMNDLIKGISQGKYYIEDFYKDNGNPKQLTEAKYQKFFTERRDLLTKYQEYMNYIINSRESFYTAEHKTSAANISASIETENQNDTTITVRFTKLPSKTGSTPGDKKEN